MFTLILKIPIDENERIRGREGIYKALRVLAGRIHGSISDDELIIMWERALSLVDPVAKEIYRIEED